MLTLWNGSARSTAAAGRRTCGKARPRVEELETRTVLATGLLGGLGLSLANLPPGVSNLLAGLSPASPPANPGGDFVPPGLSPGTTPGQTPGNATPGNNGGGQAGVPGNPSSPTAPGTPANPTNPGQPAVLPGPFTPGPATGPNAGTAQFPQDAPSQFPQEGANPTFPSTTQPITFLPVGDTPDVVLLPDVSTGTFPVGQSQVPGTTDNLPRSQLDPRVVLVTTGQRLDQQIQVVAGETDEEEEEEILELFFWDEGAPMPEQPQDEAVPAEPEAAPEPEAIPESEVPTDEGDGTFELSLTEDVLDRYFAEEVAAVPGPGEALFPDATQDSVQRLDPAARAAAALAGAYWWGTRLQPRERRPRRYRRPELVA